MNFARAAAVAVVTLMVYVPQPLGGVGEESPYLEVRFDEEAKEIVFLLGPIDLSPGAHHAEIPVQEGRIPVNGWVHGFEVQVVDSALQPRPQELLHHVNLVEPDARELFLPIARRIMAAGGETDPQEMPHILGYPVEKGTRVLMVGVFHNPTDTRYPATYLRVSLPCTPRGGLVPPKTVYPFYLDVAFPVGKKAYDLPPGQSERSWEGSPAVPGRILGVGGHLHDYGTGLRLEDVTTGKALWEVEPKVDGEGRVQSVPSGHLWMRGGARVIPEHIYRVTAFYDNPTGRTIPDGAMGTVAGMFVPEREATWPTPDPENPLYQEDLEWVVGGEGIRDGNHQTHSSH